MSEFKAFMTNKRTLKQSFKRFLCCYVFCVVIADEIYLGIILNPEMNHLEKMTLMAVHLWRLYDLNVKVILAIILDCLRIRKIVKVWKLFKTSFMFLRNFWLIYILPSFFQGLAISGAMKYAVEQINNCSSLLPGVQLDFLFNDTKVAL